MSGWDRESCNSKQTIKMNTNSLPRSLFIRLDCFNLCKPIPLVHLLFCLLITESACDASLSMYGRSHDYARLRGCRSVPVYPPPPPLPSPRVSTLDPIRERQTPSVQILSSSCTGRYAYMGSGHKLLHS